VAARGSNPRRREDELSAPRQDGLVENLRSGDEDADVLLEVPVLNIEELDLEVEDLRAHVSVRAELADFVKINVGVDAYLDKVKLGIKGVEAQLLLKVKLERILGTIERALNAIEQNPGLLDAALGEIEGTIEEPDESASEPDATDAARRKAEELGIDLSQVEGTGSGGRILVRDVQKAAKG
jgi:pyruvate/2-oxoglutarate dehydrogenase complex dihydrolipoamide acyltransferase (E2) component